MVTTSGGVVNEVQSTRSPWWGLLLLGAAVGLASGMFGVGGGIIIVPVLVYLFHIDQRIASGTSLLAIVPTALAGVIAYGMHGNVNILLAALMAIGSVVGAPVGAWLLQRLPKRALQLSFMAFLVVIIVSLFLVLPNRESEIYLDVALGALLVVLGFVAGVASGLFGIGGGVVVVPLLVLVFGASDLMAKGSSLLMIIATGLSGTIANVRQKNVDLRAAAYIGVAAGLLTPVGSLIASTLSPFAANVAFAAFLVLVIIRMGFDVWPRKKPA